MKPETAGHAAIGIGGTVVATVSSEMAAIFAGLATGLWMLWQLGCSIYDRAKRRRQRPDHFPPP